MIDFDFIQAVIKRCLQAGLLTDWFLFNDRSLRIAPPLIITEEEIRWACEVILDAVEHTFKDRGLTRWDVLH